MSSPADQDDSGGWHKVKKKKRKKKKSEYVSGSRQISINQLSEEEQQKFLTGSTSFLNQFNKNKHKIQTSKESQTPEETLIPLPSIEPTSSNKPESPAPALAVNQNHNIDDNPKKIESPEEENEIELKVVAESVVTVTPTKTNREKSWSLERLVFAVDEGRKYSPPSLSRPNESAASPDRERKVERQPPSRRHHRHNSKKKRQNRHKDDSHRHKEDVYKQKIEVIRNHYICANCGTSQYLQRYRPGRNPAPNNYVNQVPQMQMPQVASLPALGQIQTPIQTQIPMINSMPNLQSIQMPQQSYTVMNYDATTGQPYVISVPHPSPYILPGTYLS